MKTGEIKVRDYSRARWSAFTDVEIEVLYNALSELIDYDLTRSSDSQPWRDLWGQLGVVYQRRQDAIRRAKYLR